MWSLWQQLNYAVAEWEQPQTMCKWANLGECFYGAFLRKTKLCINPRQQGYHISKKAFHPSTALFQLMTTSWMVRWNYTIGSYTSNSLTQARTTHKTCKVYGQFVGKGPLGNLWATKSKPSPTLPYSVLTFYVLWRNEWPLVDLPRKMDSMSLAILFVLLLQEEAYVSSLQRTICGLPQLLWCTKVIFISNPEKTGIKQQRVYL